MNAHLLLAINGLAGKSSIIDHLMVFCAVYLIFIVFAVAAGCLGYLLAKRDWLPVVYVVAALMVSFILLQIAAHIYVDHRPFVDYHLHQLVAHAAGKSFPSDHTTAATAVAIAMLMFTRFKKIAIGLLVAAVLIGFARIFVGVHYPIDIAGGLLAGLLGSLIVFSVSKLIHKKRAPAPMPPLDNVKKL